MVKSSVANYHSPHPCRTVVAVVVNSYDGFSEHLFYKLMVSSLISVGSDDEDTDDDGGGNKDNDDDGNRG